MDPVLTIGSTDVLAWTLHTTNVVSGTGSTTKRGAPHLLVSGGTTFNNTRSAMSTDEGWTWTSEPWKHARRERRVAAKIS